MELGALWSDNWGELGQGSAEDMERIWSGELMRRWAAAAVATKEILLTVTDMVSAQFLAHYGRFIRAL
jgi:hypothetical protein